MNEAVRAYVESEIIPRYAAFDKAHSLDHVNQVIANSLAISREYDVDIDMVYVIAAYHDVGMPCGREHHERHSAVALMNDENLRAWFSPEDIRTMSEAVEDHRASSECAPRSLYGCIVSEADRDISYPTILRRTVEYGLGKFPELTPEQHYARTCGHIQEKYAQGGYLKLWLNTGHIQRRLAELRAAFADKERFRADFDRVFAQCKAAQDAPREPERSAES